MQQIQSYAVLPFGLWTRFKLKHDIFTQSPPRRHEYNMPARRQPFALPKALLGRMASALFDFFRGEPGPASDIGQPGPGNHVGLNGSVAAPRSGASPTLTAMAGGASAAGATAFSRSPVLDRLATSGALPPALTQEMQRSVALFNAGRLQEAADIYASLITRRPDMGLAYLHLSFLQWELGQTRAAIATLRTAMSRSIPSAEIEWKLGMYLSEVGALSEAIPLLEQAAARADAGVDALNALGIAYARAGRAGRAISRRRLPSRRAAADRGLAAARTRTITAPTC